MSAHIKSTKAIDQGALHMDEQKIMLKLADVLFKEHLITTNEKLELMKLIHKCG